MADTHGAAASGQRAEKKLRERVVGMGFHYIRTQVDAAKYLGIPLTPGGKVRKKDIPRINEWLEGKVNFEAPEEYKEADFGRFESDGYVPELDSILELKAGDKAGTTEEKIFFDLEKMRDKCYGDRTVLYIFEGSKEQDKNTKLFKAKVKKGQAQGTINSNVYVLDNSVMTKEVLMECK
jgi:hypothetical protein|tara:strand:+ start:1189 stop:1725 length:537 start_codon:yes stop_codon:yes gene_type:complete